MTWTATEITAAAIAVITLWLLAAALLGPLHRPQAPPQPRNRRTPRQGAAVSRVARWLARGWHAWNQPLPPVDNASLTGWLKPPAPAASPRPMPGQNPGAGGTAGPPVTHALSPAPGHHRGDHMVIDIWGCGCIYTWTRATGWMHDNPCISEELRKLLTP